MAATTNSQQVTAALSTYLAQRAIPPTQTWLNSFIESARLSTPLPALQKTATFRLLASDITNSVQASAQNTLPPNMLNATVKELKIPGPIVLQVLDIEDIGRSAWSQVESIEAQERGETTKGREIIRVVADTANAENGNAPDPRASEKSSGPHKLLLQDAKGLKVYAFELAAVEGVALTMGIGCKLVLRRATVARGVIMLDPASTEVLGGKVDAWDKSWKAARKDVLREKVHARPPI